ncbi:unnamed protein product [Cuscuta campestris]|uniref:Uncharacterized protein n=1 Tax=Cuscuta campestris TaxID=132261 RepID=A0A484LWL9_9ASTE|nr:unnamed protein product [Cuscuta campestris]
MQSIIDSQSRHSSISDFIHFQHFSEFQRLVQAAPSATLLHGYKQPNRNRQHRSPYPFQYTCHCRQERDYTSLGFH